MRYGVWGMGYGVLGMGARMRLGMGMGMVMGMGMSVNMSMSMSTNMSMSMGMRSAMAELEWESFKTHSQTSLVVTHSKQHWQDHSRPTAAKHKESWFQSALRSFGHIKSALRLVRGV